MDLPRISSQISICQGNNNNPNSRTPVSQKLLCAAQPEPQFLQLPSSAHYQPSRKREEARALQNLRRRVQQTRIADANSRRVPQEAKTANSPDLNLDNRPHLLQKILSNRPVSMVLDISEIRTAWQDSDFITDSLCWHNVYRQRHNCPPLTMSSELCHIAQTWANHLAHTNRFYYRNDKDIGQNLFCRPDNALQNDVTGQEVSTYWYSAVKQYDYGKEPDVLHANVNAGHFTQLVWSDSRYFGVGKARSRSGKIVVVAHYAPAGNQSGAFQRNVPPPVLECPPAATPRTPRARPKFVISGSGETDDSSSAASEVSNSYGSSTNQSQST